MREIEFDQKVLFLDELKYKLKEFGLKRNSTAIIFFLHGSIDTTNTLDFLKIIRREPPIQNLDLIIDSDGGDIGMAVKIVEICRHYSQKFTVIVPFFAKSAATIIALSADDLILGKIGELGPLDPQVKHPTLDMHISASSIKNALEFLESSKDPDVRITMADKFDPLLIGAYIRSLGESKQYLKEVPVIKNSKNREEIIEAFTGKYIDHGFPITYEICKRLNLEFTLKFAVDEHETLLYDIHEEAKEYMEQEYLETMILTPDNEHLSVYTSDGSLKYQDMDDELEEDE